MNFTERTPSHSLVISQSASQSELQQPDSDDSSFLDTVLSTILTVASIVAIVCTFPLSMIFCLKVVKSYERIVIFRLGRCKSKKDKSPGLVFIIPCIDNYQIIDTRMISYIVPAQDLLTKDAVSISVKAIINYKITSAIKATTKTSLREATEGWGVEVEAVEIKDILLPFDMQRFMAAEAEARREAAAKMISAQGEKLAAKHTLKAALTLGDSETALQLRYLQTLSILSTKNSCTVLFPIPIDLEISPPPVENNI